MKRARPIFAILGALFLTSTGARAAPEWWLMVNRIHVDTFESEAQCRAAAEVERRQHPAQSYQCDEMGH
jgi:hypothetical protein